VVIKNIFVLMKVMQQDMLYLISRKEICNINNTLSWDAPIIISQ